MANVVIDEQSPTGTNEVVGVPITFHLSHASGVDRLTITLTLTDPQGTSHTPISLGVFDRTNGWDGHIVTDGATGYDVVITEHNPLEPGYWAASATADSVTGGEDGTKAWTFTVVPVMVGILYGIKDLLEGTTGSVRTIPANTFRLIDYSADEATAISAVGPTYPFDIRILGHAADPALPAFVAGDYVNSSQLIRISVVYAMRPNAILELEQDIAKHEYFIRRALEWPTNWSLTAGWTGAEIVSVSSEEVSLSETASIVVRTYDIQVSIRERHA